MRLIGTFTFILISISTAFAQNYNLEAYNFHEAIIEAQQNVGKEVLYFNEQATDLNLKILKFELNRSIKLIDSIQVYNNEMAYYNAAKKLFALYKDLSQNEYPQLLKIIEDPDLEFKEFKAKKEKIFETMKKKTAAVYPEFIEAQEQYCKKYGIKLEK